MDSNQPNGFSSSFPAPQVYNFMDREPPKVEEGKSRNGADFEIFWRMQLLDINGITDFKHHEFPFTRIKKIMKSNEEVKWITAETPVLVSKACELFVSYLALRSWMNVGNDGRRTLLRDDVETAIINEDDLKFLNRIFQKKEN